jgi:CelD/BcsL family acetyltransferase involved in cellulose biosynthesis
MRTELREEQEMGEFVAWRRAQLTATGFSSSLAARTARDLDYDLHALSELA